jgi:hypothetical protein
MNNKVLFIIILLLISFCLIININYIKKKENFKNLSPPKISTAQVTFLKTPKNTPTTITKPIKFLCDSSLKCKVGEAFDNIKEGFTNDYTTTPSSSLLTIDDNLDVINGLFYNIDASLTNAYKKLDQYYNPTNITNKQHSTNINYPNSTNRDYDSTKTTFDSYINTITNCITDLTSKLKITVNFSEGFSNLPVVNRDPGKKQKITDYVVIR